MFLEAIVTLKSDAAPAFGRDRVRLLEAVARSGSIAGGARSVGLTYKAAWDAVRAMANLFGQPLLDTQSGGRHGGGTRLTPAGLKVIDAFGRLEAEMVRVLRTLEPDLAGTGLTPRDLVSGFLMKTSARNALRGTITSIRADPLQAEVAVEIAPGVTLHAVVTTESLRALGLCVGRAAVVLVKASFVLIAERNGALGLSVRNRIDGTVLRCDVSGVGAEVVLDVGHGRTVAASITADSARSLALAPGLPATALFDAAHVILAID